MEFSSSAPEDREIAVFIKNILRITMASDYNSNILLALINRFK